MSNKLAIFPLAALTAFELSGCTPNNVSSIPEKTPVAITQAESSKIKVLTPSEQTQLNLKIAQRNSKILQIAIDHEEVIHDISSQEDIYMHDYSIKEFTQKSGLTDCSVDYLEVSPVIRNINCKDGERKIQIRSQHYKRNDGYYVRLENKDADNASSSLSVRVTKENPNLDNASISKKEVEARLGGSISNKRLVELTLTHRQNLDESNLKVASQLYSSTTPALEKKVAKIIESSPSLITELKQR